jgi:hypothetical protein
LYKRSLERVEGRSSDNVAHCGAGMHG